MDFLTAAARSFCNDDVVHRLDAAFRLNECGYSEFNAAIVVFIPGKSRREQAGQEYPMPGDTRPLSLVNTDNRLVANAMRLRI